MKVCKDCNKTKLKCEFSKCSKHADGLAYKCKSCAKEYSKAYRAKNKDKLKETRREYEKGKRQQDYIPKREQNKIDAEKHRRYCQENKETLEKTCITCLIEKTLSCFDFAKKEKDGFQYICKQCNREWAKQYRKDNIAKESDRHAKYHAENKDTINARIALWQKNNPDKARANSKRFYENNKESEKERRKKWVESNPNWIKDYAKQYRIDNSERFKKYDAEYLQDNKAAIYAKTARRRAIKKQASVSWADHEKIKDIYTECIKISKETGIVHHVDHIIPLQSKYICGLHVETNLQILPWYENLTKLNKFKPG